MYFIPGQKEWFKKEKWKLRGRWLVVAVLLYGCGFGAGAIYSVRRVMPEVVEKERAQLTQEIAREKTRTKSLSEENADLYGVIGEAFGKNAKLMIETWRAKQKNSRRQP